MSRKFYTPFQECPLSAFPNTECPHFPFSRPNGADPAPENAELLQKNPITLVELFDGKKAWLFTRHEDCCTILESQDFSAVRAAFLNLSICIYIRQGNLLQRMD